MSTIVGFAINPAISDLDVNGGLTLRGLFATNQFNANVQASEIGISVIVNGVLTPISGVMTVTADPSGIGGDFAFTITAEAAAQAGIMGSGNAVFKMTHFGVPEGQTWQVSITCFYSGTKIATPSGEVAVEDLSIGDLVLRQDGTAAPIRWMGRNTISMIFADKLKALPIRIKKDALDENVPSRDLLVSSDHAILVDDVLVQAGTLVNCTSIIRETDVPPRFVYYHVELADHALIIAENTPVETFIDNVDRMAFDNWLEHQELYGHETPLVEMDLPRAKSRRQVPVAIRQHLDRRAVELGYSVAAVA